MTPLTDNLHLRLGHVSNGRIWLYFVTGDNFEWSIFLGLHYLKIYIFETFSHSFSIILNDFTQNCHLYRYVFCQTHALAVLFITKSLYDNDLFCTHI
jgi:hypothetical protein